MSLYRQKGMLMFWTHETLAPWQTEEWKEQMRDQLRPNAYLRMIENQWVSADSRFITAELWDQNVDPNHHPLAVSGKRSPLVFLGVDIGIKNDHTGVTGVFWDGERLCLACHRIWKPSKQDPMDLTLLEKHLWELCRKFRVASILVDPYQAHRSITTLQSAGLPIKEFPQTSGNVTRMGSTLFDVLKSKSIRLYEAPELRAQALSTIAIETGRGFRIAKEKASKKIDAIVALSMALVAALEAVAKSRNSSLTWGRGADNSRVPAFLRGANLDTLTVHQHKVLLD